MSSYGAQGKRRKTKTGRAAKQTFASKVKRLVLKQAELKKFYSKDSSAMYSHYGHANDALQSNLQNMLGVGVGTTNQTRIGQEVHGKNIEVDLLYQIKDGYPQQNVRVLVFREDAGTAATPPGFMVAGSTLANINILGDVDTDKYKVVYDKIIKIDGQQKSAGTENCFSLRFKIPLNKKIVYRDATKPDGKNTYSMMVIPYVSTEVAAGTLVGTATVSSKFNFQDL